MKPIVILFFNLLLISGSVCSQKAFIHNYEITLSKGFKETIVQKNEVEKEIDFLNYIYRFPLLLEDAYTGLALGFSVGDKIDFKSKVLFDNAVNFKNYKVSVSIFPRKNLGYRFGFYRYEQVLNRYFDFPFTQTYGYDFLIADLKSKERFFSWTYNTGIIWKAKIKKLQLETSINAGVCSFSQINIDLLLKKHNSNNVLKINYVTFKDWYGMLFPEIEAKYDLFATERYNAGIKFSANSIVTSRQLNYEKLVFENTDEVYKRSLIFPKNHWYFRYDVDLGIYFKW